MNDQEPKKQELSKEDLDQVVGGWVIDDAKPSVADSCTHPNATRVFANIYYCPDCKTNFTK